MLEGTEPKPLAEPSADQVVLVAALIDEMLADERSPKAVATYYDGTSRYAGDTFLGLAPNEPYAIGVADLLAVTLRSPSPSPSPSPSLYVRMERRSRA